MLGASDRILNMAMVIIQKLYTKHCVARRVVWSRVPVFVVDKLKHCSGFTGGFASGASPVLELHMLVRFALPIV